MSIYKEIFKNTSELNQKEITKNSEDILKMRYFIDKDDGTKESTFSELCRRVSRILTSADTTKDIEYKKNIEKSIYNDMLSQRFLFNSPCLFNAGVGISKNPKLSKYLYTDEITDEVYDTIYKNISNNQMLFACFVIDVPDSLEGIFDSVKKAAIISKSGGGVGANFGNIREKNSDIKNGENGKSSGPVSFMKTWNTMGEVVQQGGKRRSALMGMLYSNHPDIEEFIDAKTEEGVLSYFNISVAIDDLFMKAVKEDLDYCLISPKDKAVVKTIKARELYNKICDNAWKRGDPGIFFVDLANKDSLLKLNNDWNLESTNPCGEQPLPNNSSCNLGSINLYEFVDKESKTFDWKEFKNQIIRSVYYLDLVIDATKYPLPIIERRTKAIRPVGLGFMGLADTMIELGIKYGSKESLDFSNEIAECLAENSLIATLELAKVKEKFKEFDSVLQLLNQNVSYNKIVDNLNIQFDGDIKDNFKPLTQDELDDINWVKTLIDKNIKYKYFIEDSIYEQLIDEDNSIPLTFKNALMLIENMDYIYDLFSTGIRNSRRLSIAPTGTISMILNSSSALEPNFAFEWDRWVVDTNGTDRVLKKYYHKLNTPENKNKGLLITANELSWKEHLNIVKVFAQYIDSAISKTINFTQDATVDEIKEAYMYCFDNNIKGTTIYRDGSRNSQPIISKDNKQEDKKEEDKIDKEYDTLEYLPTWLPAIRNKCQTKYGSLYVITSFFKGKPVEIYISAGKSGSQLKSAIEAISRVISIGLRSNLSVDNIIRTMMGISESEIYVYDALDGSEEFSSSIPDTVAKVIRDTMRLIKNKDLLSDVLKNVNNTYTEQVKGLNSSNLIINTTTKEVKEDNENVCPKCGSKKYVIESGCHVCRDCGYSPCG